MEHLLQIGFSITGFTIVVLFFKNETNRQSKYAKLLLSLWFLRFLSLYLKDNLNLYDFPFLILFDQSLFFLDGVLFYWYVRSLSKPQKLKIQFLQIIPFLLAFGLSIITFLSIGTPDLVDQYNTLHSMREMNGNQEIGLEVIIFFLLILLVNGFFVYKSIKIISTYRNSLRDNFSNLFNIRVSWLKTLIYFWLVFSFIPLVLFCIGYVFQPIEINNFEYLFIIGIWLTSIFFSIKVISQKYLGDEFLLKPSKSNNNIRTSKENAEIFAKLSEFMEKNTPYKNENLTLHMLAQQLALKPNKLSLAINTQNETNFHEFINNYRVEAVKKELLNTSEQIIIIAYKNGFNSKSTFNSVFKKTTGMTPSQYRKSSN